MCLGGRALPSKRPSLFSIPKNLSRELFLQRSWLGSLASGSNNKARPTMTLPSKRPSRVEARGARGWPCCASLVPVLCACLHVSYAVSIVVARSTACQQRAAFSVAFCDSQWRPVPPWHPTSTTRPTLAALDIARGRQLSRCSDCCRDDAHAAAKPCPGLRAELGLDDCQTAHHVSGLAARFVSVPCPLGRRKPDARAF